MERRRTILKMHMNNFWAERWQPATTIHRQNIRTHIYTWFMFVIKVIQQAKKNAYEKQHYQLTVIAYRLFIARSHTHTQKLTQTFFRQ